MAILYAQRITQKEQATSQGTPNLRILEYSWAGEEMIHLGVKNQEHQTRPKALLEGYAYLLSLLLCTVHSNTLLSIQTPCIADHADMERTLQ